MRSSCLIITTVLLVSACLPSPTLQFTLPRDSSPRKSGNQNNFRTNEADDIPELSRILKASNRSTQQRNVDEYRQQRYSNKRPRPVPFNNTTKPIESQARQINNGNRSLSQRLSELSEWANRGQGERAEELLIELEDEGIEPRMAYLATIRAWLSIDRVTQALNVVARMEASRYRVKIGDYRPILKAFIRIGKPNEAIRLINHMAKCKTRKPILEDYDFEDPKRRKSIWSVLSCSVLPDARCLVIVANEFVKKDMPNKLKVVSGLFEWAKRYKQADDYLFNVALTSFDDPRDMERFLMLHAESDTDAICYMTVMQGYFKQTYCYQRGKKMESLLRRLEAAQAGGAIQPDLVTYRQVLRAYFGEKDGKGAAQFLKVAFDDVQSGKIKDTDYSTDLFVSWSKTVVDMVAKGEMRSAESTKLTLDVVLWLERFMEWKDAVLGIEFYHFVMDNHIRAKGATAIPFVEMFYQRLQAKYRKSRKYDLKPTAKTLNIVLKAYGQSRDSAIMERAEGLLLRMEDTYKSRNSTEHCVVPDVVSYSTVIQGWASCRCPDSIQRADGIAKRLNSMYSSGNEAAKPDEAVDLALLNSYLWQGQEGKEKAALRRPFIAEESIASLVDRSPPDLIALTNLIRDRRSSDAGEQAEAIIDRLLVRYNETRDRDCLPDAHMFTSAISAWGHTQLPFAAPKAEILLDTMMLLYDLTKSEKLKPNSQHFIAVIRAYAQPNQPEKAQNAKRVFDRMLTLHDNGFLAEVPERDAFIAVLKACSHARGISYEKKRELDIVKIMYALICNGKYCSHNEASYGAYIGAVRNCMERSPIRTSVLKMSFERCCNEGFVDAFILGQLKRSLTPREFEEIVGNAVPTKGIIETNDLPTYWCRNVVKQQIPRRRC